MSVYLKTLQQRLEREYPQSPVSGLLDRLFAVGVLDYTLMKVLAVREYVQERLREGGSKLEAMWAATEVFACSYEYVRKCVYYYKDVNWENGTPQEP